MRNQSKLFALPFRHLGRIFVLCSAFALLLCFSKPVFAQVPDELIRLAEGALNRVFTACSSINFLECITVENKGSSLDSFMNRAVNGGTEATDIRVIAAPNAADAQRNFQADAARRLSNAAVPSPCAAV